MNVVFKEDAILASANKLFIEQGYKATTMRQVSDDAGVSLGLIGYYYKSKRQLAVRILTLYISYLKKELAKYVDITQNPLLHSAALVRICIEFFYRPIYRNFYLEALAYDIYMESIQSLGNMAGQKIGQAYNTKLSDDIMLLYDNYIPPSVEKILVLNKEDGKFPSINYEDIPDIVFSASVEKFIDHKAIKKAAIEGKVLARKVLSGLPENVNEKIISLNEVAASL